MKKKIALILVLMLAVSMLGACSKKRQRMKKNKKNQLIQPILVTAKKMITTKTMQQKTNHGKKSGQVKSQFGMVLVGQTKKKINIIG